MKKLVALLLITQNMLITGCEKANTAVSETPTQKSMVKGVVKNADGSPIANAKVVIENTIFLASYLYGNTNTKGEYSVAVPNGSWKASVQFEKDFLGKTYKFDLHPDNPNPFTGSDGAIRNFTWKLSGVKPDGGFYGSNVAVYSEPGSVFLIDDIELTLTPEGPLVNGGTGSVITKKLIDIGGGEDGIKDVPIGKYIITAKNVATNEQLQIRYRNKGNYVNALSAVFTSGFTGSTTYQIVVDVK